MFIFKVSGMTCNGCINAITRAVNSQDPQAKVTADLAMQTVSIDTSLAELATRQVVSDAGFPVIG